MLGKTYDSEVCSAARALELVGERWTLLIVRNALFAGARRYGEFKKRLGIATNVLKVRLLVQPVTTRGRDRRRGRHAGVVLGSARLVVSDQGSHDEPQGLAHGRLADQPLVVDRRLGEGSRDATVGHDRGSGIA